MVYIIFRTIYIIIIIMYNLYTSPPLKIKYINKYKENAYLKEKQKNGINVFFFQVAIKKKK